MGNLALRLPISVVSPHSELIETAGLGPPGRQSGDGRSPAVAAVREEGALDRPRALSGPRGRATCAARDSPATFQHHALLGLRAPLASGPLLGAVSLTHGLGHLQLLVEPLAQDLRHDSAWASYSKRKNQAHWLASSCCQRQPVAKEAYPGWSSVKS